MAVTADMALLFERLRNDAPTRAQFQADRQAAIAGYDLTAHERDAVLTSDCDDLVALGLASTVANLPDVLDCPQFVRPGLSGNILDRLKDLLKPLRDRLPFLDRFPLPPPFRRQPVPPRPPEPGPRPDPTPGPDPPKPDRPGGGG